MNKIEEQLAKIIEKAMLTAEQTGQFVLEQAPDIIQQFLTWRFTYHLFLTFIFLGLMIFIPYAFKQNLSLKTIDNDHNDVYIKRKGRLWYKDRSVSGSSEAYFFYIVIKISSLLFLIGVVINLLEVFYIYTAPKVYLIEYFVK